MYRIPYRPEIDGLRAIAVISVIFYHAGLFIFSGGYAGVDVFFVISGYLITSIISKDIQSGNFSLLKFYERRARRIFPALFFMIICCTFLAWLWFIPVQIVRLAESSIFASFFSSNIFFFFEDAQYYKMPVQENPLLHTWSLGVEEQFYILFPLLVLLIWPHGKRRLFSIISIILIASLALTRFNWLDTDYTSMANFYLLPTRAWELAIGVLCALSLQNKSSAHKSKTAQLLSLLGILSIFYSILFFDQNHNPFPSLYALVPTVGTALIILFARKGTFANRVLSGQSLVQLGLISYSAYLWHFPLFAFAKTNDWFNREEMVLFILLSLALGFISWKYIENPFRNAQKIPARKFITIILAALIFINLVSALLIKENGMFLNFKLENNHYLLKDSRTERDNVVYRLSFLGLDDFDDTDAKKLLFIGDSFSDDVMESMYQIGLLNGVDVAKYFVWIQCGDFLKEKPDSIAKDYSDYETKKYCTKHPGDDEKFKKLLKRADIILWAQNWPEWSISLVPEDIERLRKISKAKLIIFGTKNFGTINTKHLLKLNVNQRLNLRNTVDPSYDISLINNKLKEMAGKTGFIDTQYLLCNDEQTCPVFFADDLKLISFDGYHLTHEGLFLLGDKLKKNPLIIQALDFNTNSKTK